LEAGCWILANARSRLVLEISAAHFSSKRQRKNLHDHFLHQQLLQQAILRTQIRSPIIRTQHLIAEGIVPGKKMGLLLQEAKNDPRQSRHQ
jgi:poly(A) polymerase